MSGTLVRSLLALRLPRWSTSPSGCHPSCHVKQENQKQEIQPITRTLISTTIAGGSGSSTRLFKHYHRGSCCSLRGTLGQRQTRNARCSDAGADERAESLAAIPWRLRTYPGPWPSCQRCSLVWREHQNRNPSKPAIGYNAMIHWPPSSEGRSISLT